MTEPKDRKLRLKRERKNVIGEAMQHNYKRGVTDGIAQGRENGLREGMKQGFLNGRTAGLAEAEQVQAAKKLVARGAGSAPRSLPLDTGGYDALYHSSLYMKFIEANLSSFNVTNTRTDGGDVLIQIFTVMSQHVAGTSFYEAMDQAIAAAIARGYWEATTWSRKK